MKVMLSALTTDHVPVTRSMGFLQKKSGQSVVLKARNILSSIKSTHATQLALIQYSLKAKAVDFSKVVAMIDGMTKVLGKEQTDDDTQKKFCDDDLAKSEAEKAGTEATEQRKEEHGEFLTSQSENSAA